MPYELHYATRTIADRLPTTGLGTSHVFTYISRERDAGARRLDIPALLQRARRDAHFYVCGPPRLIDAVRTVAKDLGWPAAAVHAESFGASVAPGDRPIAVHLDVSEVTLQVAPGTSILQAMLDRGVWASYGCQRGACGSCYVEVTDGVVDHRDVCLTAAQRHAGMCPCVSWPVSDELTLRA